MTRIFGLHELGGSSERGRLRVGVDAEGLRVGSAPLGGRWWVDTGWLRWPPQGKPSGESAGLSYHCISNPHCHFVLHFDNYVTESLG